jgi:G3E family GTPase
MRRAPAAVITGFLGVGKTSLVRHPSARAEGLWTRIVGNEFTEFGIEPLLACDDTACRRRSATGEQ